MRLKVGDNFLDGDRSIIAQTFEVNELGNIQTRQGGFSNDFTIPLTGKNKGILGLPNDINSASRNPYEKIEATLFERGAPVAFGFLKYQIVNENTLQASFFSDNSEWFSLIKDKKLTDVDLSDYDHTYDYTTVAAAINADKTSGYTYPLIDYGEFGSAADLKVSVGQMFPAIFVHSLIEKIFFDAGWKVDGEVTQDERYKRRIIPFSAKAFNHSQAYIEENSTTTLKDVDQVFGSGATDATWTGGGVNINAAVDGRYNILLQLDVDEKDAVFPATSYDVNINVGGVPAKTVNAITLFDQIVIINVEDVDLLTSDNVTVAINTSGGAELQPILAANTFMTLNVTPLIAEGTEVQMSAIMPDMKQSDLLKYIAFSFGAILQANTLSKTVTWSFFKSLKINIDDYVDWSAKLDRSKPADINFTYLLNNYGKTSIMNYKEDSNDEELVAYKSETEENFGQGQLDIDNEFIAEIRTIYEAPFTPMININSFTNTIYIPQIRYLDASGDLEVKPNPKIGILSENIDVDLLTNGQYTDLEITNEADSLSTTATSIPFCWFAKISYTVETNALLDSCVFGQIAFPNVIGQTLKEQFLQDYEDVLSAMKFINPWFRLTESDISELDFAKVVYIDFYKSYFYISKIENFTGSDRTTKTELVKIG